MSGARRNTEKAEIVSNFLGGEDVTISGYLPPSLVTLCHQNLAILTTTLPPPSGDVIFKRPLNEESFFDLLKFVSSSLLLVDPVLLFVVFCSFYFAPSQYISVSDSHFCVS